MKKTELVKCEHCNGKGMVVKKVESYNVEVLSKQYGPAGYGYKYEEPLWLARLSTGSGTCLQTGIRDLTFKPKDMPRVSAFYKKLGVRIKIYTNYEED